MKYKFLQAAVTGLMLTVCNMANAGLIIGSGWDDDNNIETGSFSVSNGLSAWTSTDLFLIQHDPGVISGQEDDFAVLFNNFGHLSTGLNSLSTTGGASNIGTLWSIGTGADIMNVSFLGNYVVDLFTDELFNATGEGYLTYGTNSVLLSFVSEATNNGISASILTTYTVKELTNPNISVPEPSTLAILALGIMGLASRRFKKQ